MSNRLSGKNAVVTGAGRGIGRQVALMFAQQGANVLACDINGLALEALRAEAKDQGLDIVVHAADLTNEAQVAGLATAAGALFEGQVHALVNGAAITVFGWIGELDYAGWQTTIRGEVDTVFLVTSALWSLLTAGGKGSIINFSSANSHVALDKLPAIAHTAGKGAVMAMTRQMAMEGGPKGIRANSIAPGFTVTEETQQHLGNEEMMASVRSKLMIDHLGQTSDIGWLAVYLASDESRYVTGSDYRIDGGATAW